MTSDAFKDIERLEKDLWAAADIIADYNREKDHSTVEDTFTQLVDLANSLSEEERRAAEEGLSESELALFDLLFRDQITKKDRERLKQASKSLIESLRTLLADACMGAESVDRTSGNRP